ncbi:MAG TPA: PQQ-binding-like beta-propeller repeat protein, partial [Thermoanaerobaculia bacterium]
RIAGQKSVAFTASPVAADGKLYFASEDGEVYVVKAGPKFELLATNPMGEVLMATPAIVDGMILVRGRSHLVAIREAKAPAKPAGR